MTPILINAVKIIIYDTKHTTNTKIPFQQSKIKKYFSKTLTFLFIIYQIFIIRILYILVSNSILVFICINIYIYVYIFIYIAIYIVDGHSPASYWPI